MGRFCHNCGQENIVTHQKFWSLARHFIYDVLHFDGKFFHTLLYIFTRPGFVARQYISGKRISYLDPIRMYLFTSALFFLVFFSLNNVNLKQDTTKGQLTNEDRRELAEEYRERLQKHPADSVLQDRITLLLDSTRPVNRDTLNWREETLVLGKQKYASVQAYDSIQASLPKAEKDSWWERLVNKKAIQVNEKYAGSEKKAITILLDGFVHRLPYLLFISLPFFALILKMLYNRRKNFFYSDHAVFTLYHYIFSFILLLVAFGVTALRNWTGWSVFTLLLWLLIVSWPLYLYMEMKHFYGQGTAKTLGKFLLLNTAGFFILLVLFVVFFLFSIIQL